MKFIRSEQGHTLLLTIFVLSIATIIGLTLISISLNGTTRNVHRENYTQATKHAEDGISHITTYIENELEKIIPSPSIGSSFSLDTFKSNFRQILNEYDCSNKNLEYIDDGITHYSVCIQNKGNNDLYKKVEIKSTGYANGEEKTIIAEVLLGVKHYSYPSFLDFAVATHNGGKQKSDSNYKSGNLTLNGGIEIRGNVLADGNIVVSNFGYAPVINKNTSTFTGYKLSRSPWIDTVYPVIIRTEPNQSANVFINKDKRLFVMKKENFKHGCSRSSDVISLIKEIGNAVGDLLGSLLFQADILGNYFTYYDLIYYNFDEANDECIFEIKPTSELNTYLSNNINKQPTIHFTEESKNLKVDTIISSGKSFLYNKTYNDNNIPFIIPKTINGPGYVKNRLLLLYDHHSLNGNFYFNRSSASLTNHSSLIGNYYFHNSKEDTINLGTSLLGAANTSLDGQFYIDRGKPGLLGSILDIVSVLLGGNINAGLDIDGGKNHTIEGVYYIDGDVDIYNATVKADAILFVDGNVFIKRSKIESLNNGKLIIFATGNIIYDYFSELGANIGKEYYNKDPIELNAYLYSDKKIELHGTLSNIHLKGGIAANQVLLSGIRGEVENMFPVKFKDAEKVDANSRLVIEYDATVVDAAKN